MKLNNKTLLDEFAMAALTGWLPTFRGDESPTDQLGAFCYDIAEVMMAERAKRMPAESSLPNEPLSFGDTPNYTDFETKVLRFVQQKDGRRMTCTEIFTAVTKPNEQATITQSDLQAVGAVLRKFGYQRVRSGDKDYYQL